MYRIFRLPFHITRICRYNSAFLSNILSNMKTAFRLMMTVFLGTIFSLTGCSSKPSHSTSSNHPASAPSVNAPSIALGTVIQGKDGVTYRRVAFGQLPQWQEQAFSGSLNAFKQSCLQLVKQSAWQNVCLVAQNIHTHQEAKAFFEQHFSAWEVAQNGKLSGTVTGYYEPVLAGDDHLTDNARFPIYGIPDDFISLNLPASLVHSGSVRFNIIGKNQANVDQNGAYSADLSLFPIKTNSIKGRLVGNQLQPYYTRNQINGGALNNRAPILAYANNPVELFFMHIQGSGRIKTPNGRYIRLGFAEKNNYPYVSIGRYMADKGYLPLAQTSMQNIKQYLADYPNRLAEVLGQNPSYVFFRELTGSPELGPIGALGVPLTGEFSGAIDKRYITLGAPIFLATTHPNTQRALNKLIMAQDTGSAIKGAVRVDYFWGYGDAAGQMAGKQKHTGYVWQLLPNGLLPNQL